MSILQYLHAMLSRTIPSTGEILPAIGLGTWQIFDVGPSHYATLQEVLGRLHKAGSRLVDTSPMYGRAEEAIGAVTGNMPEQNDFFYATKVWTQGADAGKKQIDRSYQLMRRKVMDLIQIHNLVNWQAHLPYLRRLKEEGRLRYIGITHYQNSSHEALAAVLKQEPVDFVQFNYSLFSRNAENLLLPLSRERGVATIINRPFSEGDHFRRVANKPLPGWAKELGIDNWAAFFLKFILAHPAVTCVIPATGNPDHAAQNLQAGTGPLPDAKTIKKMIALLESR